MNHKAAPGVDGMDWKAFRTDLTGNIQRLATSLKKKKYKARLVRRRNIPKPGGKQRPLVIPVIGDKLVQTAVAQILSAIYEQDFLPCSHGYRRGRGPQRAALELSLRLHKGRFKWIVDADIKGFFDHIDHDWLLKMLAHRINDRTFIGLIRKWLKAGILEEDGQVVYPVTGTPQGGVVSAVLANIYLHYALDLWFEKAVRPRCRGDVFLMRFADDFVCGFQYRDDERRFSKVLDKRLLKFGLELSAEKTKVIRFTRFELEDNNSFTFLGFEYRWGLSRKGKPLVTMRTSKQKFRLALAAIQSWIKKDRSRLCTADLLEKLGQKLLGHWNYYGVSGNYGMLKKFYWQVCGLCINGLTGGRRRKAATGMAFRKCCCTSECRVPG